MFAVPKEEDYERVESTIAELDLKKLADRTVSHLSGGERQRVAVAARGSSPKANLNSGTMTVPPPMPSMPDKMPIATPMIAAATNTTPRSVRAMPLPSLDSPAISSRSLSPAGFA